MMYISKELAMRMEACIMKTHIAVTKEYTQGKILDIAGGAACFSGIDSHLSQVINWGFATKAKHFAAEVKLIEDFYRSLNHSQADIELCPYAGSELAQFLSKSGYCIAELNNVSCFDLSHYKIENVPSDEFMIKVLDASALDEWAKRVAFGFNMSKAQTHFSHYARAPGVIVFGAYQRENLIAGGILSVHDAIGDLGATSILPAFRNRGLHKRLLHARLAYGKDLGLEYATVTTEPASISDLNVQKLGFRTAYTRIKMSLEF